MAVKADVDLLYTNKQLKQYGLHVKNYKIH